MPEYRCYFFGSDLASPDGQRAVADEQRFVVRTDDEARLRAHMIYRRRNLSCGFEIWLADILVSRHPGASSVPPSRLNESSQGKPVLER